MMRKGDLLWELGDNPMLGLLGRKGSTTKDMTSSATCASRSLAHLGRLSLV